MKHNKKAQLKCHAEVFCLSISTAYPKQRDLEQQRLKMTGVFGFTLVELLVVVLIIGILSAIAVPMYQGAVDKSHWSTMLPASKAIKDAQEAIKMTNGYYTSNMNDLDVRMNSTDLDFVLDIKDSLSEPNVIRVTNSKLGDKVRLASYLDDSPKFAGQLHCEAKNEGSTPNERGQRLCEKLLGGQELTNENGYTGYLLDQSIDKATCDNAGRVWSNNQTKCYKTEKDRCEGLGMPYENGFCGYKDQQGTADNRLVIEEGGTCKGSLVSWNQGCKYTEIHAGGTCESVLVDVNHDGHTGVCNYAKVDGGAVICNGAKDRTCGWYGTFDNGGVCVGMNSNDSCGHSYFRNGSICYANSGTSCRDAWTLDMSGFYDETSCCCGKYCPYTAPKCSDRGIACDPQYMK